MPQFKRTTHKYALIGEAREALIGSCLVLQFSNEQSII